MGGNICKTNKIQRLQYVTYVTRLFIQDVHEMFSKGYHVIYIGVNDYFKVNYYSIFCSKIVGYVFLKRTVFRKFA